jgi:hypothetical protein
MKVEIRITVSADDGSSPRSATSALLLATGLEGVDVATAKQDFLTQAEGLVRTISESQLPALYQASLEEQAKAAEAKAKEKAEEAEQSNAVAAARVKLRKLRQRKGQEAGQEAARADQEPGVDVVECIDCGAKLESDMAHYVTVVEDGEFKRDAVLCDACYNKGLEARRAQSGQPLEANDGGTRPETGGTDGTGETGENGEATE